MRKGAKYVNIISDAGMNHIDQKASFAFYIMTPKRDIAMHGHLKEFPNDIGEAEAKALINALMVFARVSKGEVYAYINLYCDNTEVVNHIQKNRGKNWDILQPTIDYVLSKYDTKIVCHHLSADKGKKQASNMALLQLIHGLCDFRTKMVLYPKRAKQKAYMTA